MNLGRVGVWLPLHQSFGSLDDGRRLAVRIEELGYGSLWGPETVGGREAFAHYGILLAATERLVIGTGIANMWARHAHTMQAGAATLAAGYPDRFVLGIGSGYAAQAEMVGQTYEKPVETLRHYLDQMDQTDDAVPVEPATFPRVLAALGPKMLELARQRADGVHPFLAPVEHTSFARERLGTDKLLIPHQAVMLAKNREEVRDGLMALFGGTPGAQADSPYFRNMRRFGYSDAELAEGADRVIDAWVAWGDEAAIATRVEAQHAAGADSVLIHPIPNPRHDVMAQLELIAPALR